jgi:hypothetical protein
MYTNSDVSDSGKKTAPQKETAQNGGTDHSGTETARQEARSGRMDRRDGGRPAAVVPFEVVPERYPIPLHLSAKRD